MRHHRLNAFGLGRSAARCRRNEKNAEPTDREATNDETICVCVARIGSTLNETLRNLRSRLLPRLRLHKS